MEMTLLVSNGVAITIVGMSWSARRIHFVIRIRTLSGYGLLKRETTGASGLYVRLMAIRTFMTLKAVRWNYRVQLETI